jgi:hypothetical protein
MDVQIFIRNSEGMMVDTVTDEMKAAGEHTIEWNRDKLEGGVYFLVFHAGRFVEVKKLILLDR